MDKTQQRQDVKLINLTVFCKNTLILKFDACKNSGKVRIGAFLPLGYITFSFSDAQLVFGDRRH